MGIRSYIVGLMAVCLLSLASFAMPAAAAQFDVGKSVYAGELSILSFENLTVIDLSLAFLDADVMPDSSPPLPFDLAYERPAVGAGLNESFNLPRLSIGGVTFRA